MVTFDQRPERAELGEPLGWGEVSGGFVVEHDDTGRWLIRPQLIPVRIVGYWMTGVLSACIAVSVMFVVQGPWAWPFVLAGIVMGMAAVWTMVGLFAAINRMQGEETYVIVDPRRRTVRLPRLDREWSIDQVESVVLVKFARLMTQVTLLIEERGGWTYAHVFNGGEGMRLTGCPTQLAEQLGTRARELAFSRQETKQLFQDRGIWPFGT